MRRHHLVFVTRDGWRAALAAHGGLASDPLVAGWVGRGWPLVARRPLAGEGPGAALGLPLPPSAGKRRLSFLVRAEDVLSTAPPPALGTAGRVAPQAWRPTIDRLCALASRYGVEARVFGSLAWQSLTGLDYLSESSDLDLLLRVRGGTDLPGLVAGLADIDAASPMRLDGELLRDDGAAASWRELHSSADEVLVKTAGGVALIDKLRFRLGGTPA
jgi:phosphoribosyl-dephospho-CoA transferase